MIAQPAGAPDCGYRATPGYLYVVHYFLLYVTYFAFSREIYPNPATNFADSDGKISSIGGGSQRRNILLLYSPRSAGLVL
jgi:hypothetical protein